MLFPIVITKKDTCDVHLSPNVLLQWFSVSLCSPSPPPPPTCSLLQVCVSPFPLTCIPLSKIKSALVHILCCHPFAVTTEMEIDAALWMLWYARLCKLMALFHIPLCVCVSVCVWQEGFDVRVCVCV